MKYEWKINIHLANVAHNDLANEDLVALTATHDRKFVLTLDAALQSTKLPFLGVVVEGSHEDDNDDRYQNGQPFNPFVVFIFFMPKFLCKNFNVKKTKKIWKLVICKISNLNLK